MARTSLILRHQRVRKRRDRLAIMAEILTEKNVGRTKTSVMHKCNLNLTQIETYNKILLEKKLLAKQIDDNRQVIFVVTQRGKGFIKNFYRLQSQIE